METAGLSTNNLSFKEFKAQVLWDYKIAFLSRECSIVGRREVLTGKAKFGIFGDGKELPQLAWARVFQKGDFRSGYYRDQTFMFALDLLKPSELFAGLYAFTDIEEEPFSAGRQMGGHFVTHSISKDGSWKNLTEQYNSACDLSPTAGQIPRLLGLAQASLYYKNNKQLKDNTLFSKDGKEVAWGSIGNASTSEGIFLETINAAGVMQVPLVISVWDDEYGISVPNKYHTTKGSISEALQGFKRDETNKGWEIISVKGWDYIALIEAYEKANTLARNENIPVLVHITELTQPQGHSSSGSHERYKSQERLKWENEFDCNKQFRKFIIESKLATEEELITIEKEIHSEVKYAKITTWKKFNSKLIEEQQEALTSYKKVIPFSKNSEDIKSIITQLESKIQPIRKDILETGRKLLRCIAKETFPEKKALQHWFNAYNESIKPKYNSFLYDESKNAATKIKEITPNYTNESPLVDGRVILRDNFDKILETNPKVLIFGEDTGKIGDVNQGLEGLQDKYGELRVADTSIREPTIIGQGIGLSLRGLRPIAEIQYLDYILYCLQVLGDDLASLRYRSFNKQIAPLIIRTRGHRLEGIWHSGSPMGGIIHLLRGIYILVPRNMTKAAGFYNTLLAANEPALVIESLNGYRLKEKLPNNIGAFRTPIGISECIQEGTDITLVSYGSTLRLVIEACTELKKSGISAEVIDLQSLIPLDLEKSIQKSVQKTNRLLIIDEDVPGGATGYILQHLIDEQDIFKYLDSPPYTLSAKPHRPAFSTDGDYFSKPSIDDIFEKVYDIMHEANPKEFPRLR